MSLLLGESADNLAALAWWRECRTDVVEMWSGEAREDVDGVGEDGTNGRTFACGWEKDAGV